MVHYFEDAEEFLVQEYVGLFVHGPPGHLEGWRAPVIHHQVQEVVGVQYTEADKYQVDR